MAVSVTVRGSAGASGGGISPTLLKENFSSLPAVLDSLQNGHALHLFNISEKNATKAATVLAGHYGFHVSCTNPVGLKISLLRKSLKKFRKLTNVKEKQAFLDFCSKPFRVPDYKVKPGSSESFEPGVTAVPLVTASTTKTLKKAQKNKTTDFLETAPGAQRVVEKAIGLGTQEVKRGRQNQKDLLVEH
jgi:hypothetical protein